VVLGSLLRLWNVLFEAVAAEALDVLFAEDIDML
jgi:hypothetical protein